VFLMFPITVPISVQYLFFFLYEALPKVNRIEFTRLGDLEDFHMLCAAYRYRYMDITYIDE